MRKEIFSKLAPQWIMIFFPPQPSAPAAVDHDLVCRSRSKNYERNSIIDCLYFELKLLDGKKLSNFWVYYPTRVHSHSLYCFSFLFFGLLFVSIGKLIKLKSLIDEAKEFKQRWYEGGSNPEFNVCFDDSSETWTRIRCGGLLTNDEPFSDAFFYLRFF